MMTKGQIMKSHREAAGMSIRKLAARAGVSAMCLSRLERDENQGCITTIEMLADALGIGIDEYIGHQVQAH